MTNPASRSSSTPPSEYSVPEAKDLLALVRLAAMDGYNPKPLCTVDDWMEEARKRVFLLYLAASSPPPPSPTQETPEEITEALDELAKAAFRNGKTYQAGKGEDFTGDVRAARSELLALYTRQREEIEEVRAINRGAAKIHLDQFQELERLKADSLTAEERALVLKGLDGQVVHVEPAYDSAIAKLRRRLSSDSGTGPTIATNPPVRVD